MLFPYLVSFLILLLTFFANLGFPTIENYPLVLIGCVVDSDSSAIYTVTTVLLMDSTTQNQLASFKTKEDGRFYFDLAPETTYQVTLKDTLFKKPYPIKMLTTRGLTDPTILRCLLPVNRKQPLPKNTPFKIIEHPRKDGMLTK